MNRHSIANQDKALVVGKADFPEFVAKVQIPFTFSSIFVRAEQMNESLSHEKKFDLKKMRAFNQAELFRFMKKCREKDSWRIEQELVYFSQNTGLTSEMCYSCCLFQPKKNVGWTMNEFVSFFNDHNQNHAESKQLLDSGMSGAVAYDWIGHLLPKDTDIILFDQNAMVPTPFNRMAGAAPVILASQPGIAGRALRIRNFPGSSFWKRGYGRDTLIMCLSTSVF